MGCPGTVARTLLWRLLCAQLGSELCDVGIFWELRKYPENDLYPDMRGSDVFHTSLCLLEALETALPLLRT